MRLFLSIGLSLGLVGLSMMAAGCDNGLGGGSRLGESCRARNDCEDDLWCINGRCSLADYNVEPTAQSCVLIECQTDGDCCDSSAFPAECDQWQTECADGFEFSCEQFANNCVCREGCQQNLCVFVCTNDDDCGAGTCSEGRCVQCEEDDDCFGDDVCRLGACVEPCSSNADCPYLHQCQAGECVETGCTTDRECIALLDNPQAFCRDTTCTLPCRNDADCNTAGGVLPREYEFNECQEGECVYVGCETDEECRIFLGVTPGSDSTAVCQ